MHRSIVSLILLFFVCTAQAVESTPAVSVVATDSVAKIESTDHAVLTFSRSGGSTADALTIRYTFGGTATTWNDYRRLDDTMPDTITIPAGHSSTAMTIKATGVNNLPNPTATFTIVSRPDYTIGTPDSATITLDNGGGSQGTVTVAVTDSIATVNSTDHAVLSFSRTGNTSNPMTVRYSFGGSAIVWNDFRRLDDTMPDNVTIPAGQSSTSLTIKAMGTNNLPDATATFTLRNSYSYTVGNPDSATITLYPAGSTPPPSPPPSVGSVIDYTTLALPVPGDHALRILSPTLLELRLINSKEPDPARVDRWDFVDSSGQLQLPPTSKFAVTVNGQSVAVTGAGFKRRPLYAPLNRRDLRIDNSLYLQLSTPIAQGAAVEVKNPDLTLWPATMLFTAVADPLRESMVLHVNQEGYAPSLPKKAMVGYYLGSLGEMDIPASSGFQIVQAATGNVVYQGNLTARPDVGYTYSPLPYQKVLEADFSSFTTPGEYRLAVPGIGASLPFLIHDGIPLAFARAYALGLYHQRCGHANHLPFTRHVHEACHTAPASIPTGSSYGYTWSVIAQESSNYSSNPRHTAPQLKDEASMLYPWVRTSLVDVSGGHHDAGDYSKYTSNSALLIHALVFAVDAIAGAATLDNLGLPESGDGIPDLLQEAKWEADFLARMQDTDGGFYFLVYPRDRRYESNVLPDAGDPQIVWPKTTSVTAAAVAALAQTASSPHFKQHYPAEAAGYLQKARLGWQFLMNAIAAHGKDGSYQKITHYGDNFMHDDELAWAAVEMYLATGERQYRDKIHEWFPDPSSSSTFRWGWWRLYESYGNAIRSYAFALPSGRDAAALDAQNGNYPEYQTYLAKCEAQILAGGDDALRWSQDSAYGTAFPDATKRVRAAGWYFSLDQAMDMAVAWQLSPKPEYIDALAGNMNYEGGSNPANVSYITGLGLKRQREIVHQYAQNDRRVLPPSGIPLGNVHASFAYLSNYSSSSYGNELSGLVFPQDNTNVLTPYPFYPFYDRWADSYNVSTEFIHVNQGRGLLALAFLTAQTSAASTPWQPASVSIVTPSAPALLDEPVTFHLNAPGLDLNGARIVWEAREQEPAYGLTYTIRPRSLGTHWVEAEVQWPDGRRAFAAGSFTADSPVVKWVDDAVPTGATPQPGSPALTWVTANPSPYSGTKAHQTTNGTGLNDQAFINATSALEVGVGDTLFTYVYLDPESPPTEIMLHWNDGSWEHRAYWGANQIPYGTNGTASRRSMGPLPASGGWVRLEIPASAVGLEGRTVHGMAFSAYGGRATFDLSGRARPGATLP